MIVQSHDYRIGYVVSLPVGIDQGPQLLLSLALFRLTVTVRGKILLTPPPGVRCCTPTPVLGVRIFHSPPGPGVGIALVKNLGQLWMKSNYFQS